MFKSKFYTDAEKLHEMLEELERKYPTITWRHKTEVFLNLSNAMVDTTSAFVAIGVTVEEFKAVMEQLYDTWPLYEEAMYRNIVGVSDFDSSFEIEPLTGVGKLASRFYFFTFDHLQRWPRPLRWRIRELARKIVVRIT
ncbi:MAG: hypothetical protein ACYSWP_07105 [Planctomycetota bacterium]|jgi:hypothetical protein